MLLTAILEQQFQELLQQILFSRQGRRSGKFFFSGKDIAQLQHQTSQGVLHDLLIEVMILLPDLGTYQEHLVANHLRLGRLEYRTWILTYLHITQHRRVFLPEQTIVIHEGTRHGDQITTKILIHMDHP